MKDKILQLARQRFFREGFHKIKMDELATELRISKKTIYKYFPSKEALISEMVDTLLEHVNSVHDEILQKNLNSVEKFTEFGKFIVHNLLTVNNNMLNDLRIHAPHLWERIDKFREERLLKNFSVILEQGKKEGYIKNIPNQIITTAFISAVRGVINPDFILTNNFSMKTAGLLTLTILVDGILTMDGKKIFNKITLEI